MTSQPRNGAAIEAELPPLLTDLQIEDCVTNLDEYPLELVTVPRAQVLAFARAIERAAIATHVANEEVGFTREQWLHHAKRVYLACGDTEQEATECAGALADEQDWHGELDEPFEMALADIEGRATHVAKAPAGEVAGLSDDASAADLWAEIHRLRAAVAGPDGYASWQEEAVAERIRRVKAERSLAQASTPVGEPAGWWVEKFDAVAREFSVGRWGRFGANGAFEAVEPDNTVHQDARWIGGSMDLQLLRAVRAELIGTASPAPAVAEPAHVAKEAQGEVADEVDRLMRECGRLIAERDAAIDDAAMIRARWNQVENELATPPAPASPAEPSEPDMRAICEALGFDPTNHHNAAKCPYCRPNTPAPVAVTREPLGSTADVLACVGPIAKSQVQGHELVALFPSKLAALAAREFCIAIVDGIAASPAGAEGAGS